MAQRLDFKPVRGGNTVHSRTVEVHRNGIPDDLSIVVITVEFQNPDKTTLQTLTNVDLTISGNRFTIPQWICPVAPGEYRYSVKFEYSPTDVREYLYGKLFVR